MKFSRTISSAIFVLMVLFLSTSAFATKYIFIGKGAWSSTANWQGNIVPPPDLKKGDTIIINGSATTSASDTTGSDFRSNSGTVIISSGASLTLQNVTRFSNLEGSSFIISGTLTNKTHFQIFKTSSVTVTSSGTLINQLWIGNQGTLTLNGGILTNSAKLDNAMAASAGEIVVNCGSSISNTSVGIFNVGNSTLYCNTRITNTGTVSGAAINKP